MEKRNDLFKYLFPLCGCVFLDCLTVGISLGTVPGFIHGALHFDNLIVGLVIGLQSVATVATRHFAGTLCDTKGSRLAVRYGVYLSVIAGLLCLLSAALSMQPVISLVVLIAGRIVLGIGESLIITGALSWGIGLLGAHRSGKVMAWVGIAIYGAVACGAPLGMFITDHAGIASAFAVLVVVPVAGWLSILRLQQVPAFGGTRIPFYKVMKEVWVAGTGLALGTVGFCCIASFMSLYFAQRGWPGAALLMTAFGAAYIIARLFFAHLPDKLGGAAVAWVCLLIEAVGQLLIWKANSPLVALAGAALTGFGFSLVFPSFGVEAVKKLGPQNKGAALGAYVAFFDLAMGASAPTAGLIAGQLGYAAIYCFGAISAGIAILMALSLRRVSATVPSFQ
jgi:predicted MFS family arabinose efflux permease